MLWKTLKFFRTGRFLVGILAILVFCGTAVAQIDFDFEITTGSPLPDGRVGEFYSVTLQANFDAIDWAVVDGNLPAGIQLNPSGVISGTPPLLHCAICPIDRCVARKDPGFWLGLQSSPF